MFCGITHQTVAVCVKHDWLPGIASFRLIISLIAFYEVLVYVGLPGLVSLKEGSIMTTKSIRIDGDLIHLAESAAAVQHRSVSKQLEHWASLGRIISSVLSVEDAFAINQGLKKIRIEPTEFIPVDSDAVFNNLESDREKGFVDKPITSAPFYFEASQKAHGLLDRVNSQTGERKTGKFSNGKFTEVISFK